MSEKSLNKKAIVIFVVALIMATGFSWFLIIGKSNTVNEIASWQVYRNKEQGYEIKYPCGYYLENEPVDRIRIRKTKGDSWQEGMLIKKASLRKDYYDRHYYYLANNEKEDIEIGGINGASYHLVNGYVPVCEDTDKPQYSGNHSYTAIIVHRNRKDRVAGYEIDYYSDFNDIAEEILDTFKFID